MYLNLCICIWVTLGQPPRSPLRSPRNYCAPTTSRVTRDHRGQCKTMRNNSPRRNTATHSRAAVCSSTVMLGLVSGYSKWVIWAECRGGWYQASAECTRKSTQRPTISLTLHSLLTFLLATDSASAKCLVCTFWWEQLLSDSLSVNKDWIFVSVGEALVWQHGTRET